MNRTWVMRSTSNRIENGDEVLGMGHARFDFIKGRFHVLWEIALGRFGLRTDFVGYEVLLRFIDQNELWRLNGDLLEIGAFMGGGTGKLAKAARAYGKKVFVVDAFDPDLDATRNKRDESMSWIYTSILGKRDLRSTFNRVTQACENVVVHAVNSKQVSFPLDQEFAFSFIDGSHASPIVKHDFTIAWKHTVSGGVVALHDYGGDLPSVTSAVDSVLHTLGPEISVVEVLPKRTIIFVRKK